MTNSDVFARALGEFPSIIPAKIAARILDLTVVQYRWKLHKLQKTTGKGSVKVETWIQNYTQEDFDWLSDAYRRNYAIEWNIAVNDYGRKKARVALTTEDCSPSQFIRETNDYLPGSVPIRLFGLTSKSLTAIRQVLRLNISPRQTAEITANFYHRLKEIPIPDCLSKAQTKKYLAIVAELRTNESEKRKQISVDARKDLLTKMHISKKESTGPFFKCTGKHCNEEWPRNEVCFYRTTDTADGLYLSCKYCNLIETQKLKRKKRGRLLIQPRIPEAKQGDATRLLKIMLGHVPVAYIIKFLKITKKQFHRLVKIEKLTANKIGSGNQMIVKWRKLEEYRQLEGLSATENSQLQAIWREDLKDFLESLKKDDQEELDILNQEMLKIRRTGAALKTRCCKGACRTHYVDDTFFFPNKSGQFKDFCVVCNRKRKRSKVWQY